MCRPEELPKICSKSLTAFRSRTSGLTNNTASSAYTDKCSKGDILGKGDSSCSSHARRMSAESTSMVMTKNMGDIGSPYLRPLPCKIFLPSTPLTRSLVLALYNIRATLLRKVSEKPNLHNTSIKNGQDRESKARVISNLRSTPGHFLELILLATRRTSKKLSCKLQPLMNTD
jgi:hypothetical protein